MTASAKLWFLSSGPISVADRTLLATDPFTWSILGAHCWNPYQLLLLYSLYDHSHPPLRSDIIYVGSLNMLCLITPSQTPSTSLSSALSVPTAHPPVWASPSVRSYKAQSSCTCTRVYFCISALSQALHPAAVICLWLCSETGKHQCRQEITEQVLSVHLWWQGLNSQKDLQYPFSWALLLGRPPGTFLWLFLSYLQWHFRPTLFSECSKISGCPRNNFLILNCTPFESFSWSWKEECWSVSRREEYIL